MNDSKPEHPYRAEFESVKEAHLIPPPAPVEYLKLCRQTGKILVELPGPWPEQLEPLRLLIDNFRADLLRAENRCLHAEIELMRLRGKA